MPLISAAPWDKAGAKSIHLAQGSIKPFLVGSSEFFSSKTAGTLGTDLWKVRDHNDSIYHPHSHTILSHLSLSPGTCLHLGYPLEGPSSPLQELSQFPSTGFKDSPLFVDQSLPLACSGHVSQTLPVLLLA